MVVESILRVKKKWLDRFSCRNDNLAKLDRVQDSFDQEKLKILINMMPLIIEINEFRSDTRRSLFLSTEIFIKIGVMIASTRSTLIRAEKSPETTTVRLVVTTTTWQKKITNFHFITVKLPVAKDHRMTSCLCVTQMTFNYRTETSVQDRRSTEHFVNFTFGDAAADASTLTSFELSFDWGAEDEDFSLLANNFDIKLDVAAENFGATVVSLRRKKAKIKVCEKIEFGRLTKTTDIQQKQ
uniref:Uncharacterized protein n=1 Tax=Romanomermis culicivorax TaxID=13658 RepID=A0A915HMX8_ROMCU